MSKCNLDLSFLNNHELLKNSYEKNNKLDKVQDNLKRNLSNFIGLVSEYTTNNFEVDQDDFYITGGAIASLINCDNVNDYDIYCKDVNTAITLLSCINQKVFKNSLTFSRQDVNETCGYITCRTDDEKIIAVKEALIKENGADSAGSTLTQIFDYNSGAVITASYNAITFEFDGEKYQLIMKIAGDIGFIHDHFDFVHCTNWYSNDVGLQLNEKAFMASFIQKLKYIGGMNPISTIMRLPKFINKGWSIDKSEFLKIAWDINGLYLNNPNVMNDILDTCGLQGYKVHFEQNGINRETVFSYDYENSTQDTSCGKIFMTEIVDEDDICF